MARKLRSVSEFGTFERSTHRDYQFVVLGRVTNISEDLEFAKWHDISWSGNRTLALKEMAKQQRIKRVSYKFEYQVVPVTHIKVGKNWDEISNPPNLEG